MRRSLLCCGTLIGLATITLFGATRPRPAAAARQGSASLLPLPSTMPLAAYEARLYELLASKRYLDLGWKKDRAVRDTGPFIEGKYYGPHPAVRIFYSPEVYEWLKAGRPDGGIPDGAMIIKEMYDPPAPRYEGMSDDELRATVSQWTVMVKDRAGSKDGWFWSYYSTEGDQAPDNDAYPFNYPLSGFGQYCLRCHASTEAGQELTFASLRNIEGEQAAGDPILYRVDDSWRAADTAAVRRAAPHPAPEERATYGSAAAETPFKRADPDFLALFNALSPVLRETVQPIPPVTLDHVVSSAGGPGQFLTSDNCLSCHDGQDTSLGHNMTLLPGTVLGTSTGAAGGAGAAAGAGADSAATTLDSLVNLSPYGEWRWSMMGLAGRDPIFYAQLESEISLWPGQADQIQDLCFHCHGVMGQRQLHLDHGQDAGRYPRAAFGRDIPLGDWQPGTPEYAWAALARDGISCMLCHQIVDDGKPFAEIVTGDFEISAPAGGSSNIYGPFDDVVTLPMENALGITPKGAAYVKRSRLCGACHAIYLPVFDRAGNLVDHDYEQTTYLEWLNSAYRTELGRGSEAKDCQDCHMPNDYRGTALDFRMANIQDVTYPEADHLAPAADITLRNRPDFRRHTLLGINLFGLEMFNQFDDILGVGKADYMSGSNDDLQHAIDAADRLAKEETATVELVETALRDNRLVATVEVTNLTGHRFPSGVGFRRAFLELLVVDAHNTVVWGSGQTNSLGVIVDASGKPLPSEFFRDVTRGGAQQQAYEPHYEVIDRQDQVQIYQELVRNTEGRFTTSFVGQAETVKDNRLLPKGWTAAGPPGFAPGPEHAGDKRWDFPAATMPKGGALDDDIFLDGSGKDRVTYRIELPPRIVEEITAGGSVTVRANLYYQAIPAPYLDQRFRTAQGDSARRLHYIASHLSVDGTPIDGWKLLIGSASAAVRNGPR